MGKISNAEVLRLRATSAISRDKSARRSAQDDVFVGMLTKNIPNKLALMGLRPGLSSVKFSRPSGTHFANRQVSRTPLGPRPFSMLEEQHHISKKQQKVNCAHQHIGSIAGEGEATYCQGKNQQNRIRRVEPQHDGLSGNQADR